MNRIASVLILSAALVAAAGCGAVRKVAEVGTSLAVSTGAMTEDQAASVTRSTAAVTKAFEPLTPEQEYYVGRAVGATLAGKYRAWDHADSTYYVNLLGQTLAQASDLPETYGGYHFLILETEEINAFAAPGGLIFVSRGLLRCCASESELAAVLAHEIAHVQHRHGLQAIKKDRLTAAVSTLAGEAARQAGGNVGELTDLLEGSIGDITGTLVNSGYSRRFEAQADETAATIMQRVGYNPSALISMLGRMKARMKPDRHDFSKTHPDPEDRIAALRKVVGPETPVRENVIMERRFARGLEGI